MSRRDVTLAWLPVALAVVALLVGAFLTGRARAQDLSDLLQCPPSPEAPECEGPIGYDLALEVPEPAWPTGTRIDVEVRPGLRAAPGGGRCAGMEGRATLPDGTESVVRSRLTSDPACVPVPEPPPLAGLGLGACALAWRRGGYSSGS